LRPGSPRFILSPSWAHPSRTPELGSGIRFDRTHRRRAAREVDWLFDLAAGPSRANSMKRGRRSSSGAALLWLAAAVLAAPAAIQAQPVEVPADCPPGYVGVESGAHCDDPEGGQSHEKTVGTLRDDRSPDSARRFRRVRACGERVGHGLGALGTGAGGYPPVEWTVGSITTGLEVLCCAGSLAVLVRSRHASYRAELQPASSPSGRGLASSQEPRPPTRPWQTAVTSPEPSDAASGYAGSPCTDPASLGLSVGLGRAGACDACLRLPSGHALAETERVERALDRSTPTTSESLEHPCRPPRALLPSGGTLPSDRIVVRGLAVSDKPPARRRYLSEAMSPCAGRPDIVGASGPAGCARSRRS
jgi:hypothetical protein